MNDKCCTHRISIFIFKSGEQGEIGMFGLQGITGAQGQKGLYFNTTIQFKYSRSFKV